MLTKDLTKFANLPENNGTLPVKVEWILDEFANCPPLSSIETLVSVARSRGMRFQFFIQSFSQLNQVYGKEIANIIQDNCALVYLKTNTVETAEIISKKLGKSTVETNSMSKSTDPMKVGANQTTSLMGKELLTVTEIIGLKYKTIIFQTVSNPIFRDTYLYSDVYPKYKNMDVLERNTSILKRITSNYYTVEELKNNYDNLNNEYIKHATEMIQNVYQQQMNKKINNIAKKQFFKESYVINNDSIASRIMENILYNYNGNIKLLDSNTYVIEIEGRLSGVALNQLEEYEKENYSLSISENNKKAITKIKIWDKPRAFQLLQKHVYNSQLKNYIHFLYYETKKKCTFDEISNI